MINKIIKTKSLKKYLFQFFVRLLSFFIVFLLYIFKPNLLVELIQIPIWCKITPLHILWFLFMFLMFTHLLPSMKNISMAIQRSSKKWEPQNFHTTILNKELRLKMLETMQQQNKTAWIVMLIWLCGNSIIGCLYLLNILKDIDLLLLTLFYFLCDYICILFFCPFQTFIMKNKCCINCRIYDWGHFMMFFPMVFIKSFFSWSLFFMSCIVLIRWELVYAYHPERFFQETNNNLQCKNCKEKLCQYKNKLKNKF